jgi:hypothetical protein
LDSEIQKLLDEHRNSVVVLLILAAFLAASFLVFGDGLTPIMLASGLFVAPFYWPVLAAVGWVSVLLALPVAILSARFAVSRGIHQLATIPLTVFLWITFSALQAGAVLELWKSREFNQFPADKKYVESIFVAYHQAFFSDHWLYVHGAAVKDCKPYIWSYSAMSFVEIEPNTAVNVLPLEWIKECNLEIEYDKFPYQQN